MTTPIYLPADTRLPPQYRFLRQRKPGAVWNVLPSMRTAGGYILDEFSRRALPGFGHMIFHYNLGWIDGNTPGILYGTNAATGEESDDINLGGQVIRLQMAPGDDDESATPAWRTVWVGTVEQQTTELGPGGDYLAGVRKFYCQDLFCSHATKARVDHSSAYVSSKAYPYSYGHPGYNSREGDGRTLGNCSGTFTASDGANGWPWRYDSLIPADKSAFYATILDFTHTGAGSTWTDAQALRHAIGISRAPFSPWFRVEDSSAPGLLDTANAWEVPVGATLWELANKILDRRRGRGLAFFDWADDSGNPTGPLTYYLRVYAQNALSVQWTAPAAGTPCLIYGAIHNSTSVDVTLEGDQRNVSAQFSLGDPVQHTYDYVELVGDPIQVLATLDYVRPSLEARWTVDEEDLLAAQPQTGRMGTRFESVCNLHGLPRAWDLICGDGGVGSKVGRVDYRCRDDGSIAVPANTDPTDTAPNLINVLHDTPLLVGYDYSGISGGHMTNAPVRYDGETENLAPSRRPPFLMIRPDVANTNQYSLADMFDVSLHLGQYGLTMVHSDDIKTGIRFFSGRTDLGGSTSITKASLVVTVGLELPHRIRMASWRTAGGAVAVGPPSSPVTRRQLIRLRGYALWLAHYGAIWSFPDGALSASVFNGQRNACGATGSVPGILRDDRDRLAAVHALASSWYLTPRRTASWTLKDCGFLPNFQTVASDGITTTDVAYPTIGQVVTLLNAGGQAYPIYTPVTDVTYTAAGNGVTTWTTDWADLNLQ